ncbi:MAG: hypothetical protein IT247_06045 [Bacteroidia bacterium]|nr:hypothetical protein [Bacteroidia bacterium]
MKKVNYGVSATTEVIKGGIDQSTQQVLYSLSGYIIGKPSPSNKYAVFCKQQGNQLWRVNLNGDSLMQITNYSVPVYSPEYNKSVGSTNLCCLHNSGTVSNSFLLFLNENGSAKDTVLYSNYGDFTWLHPSWSSSNKIAFSYYDDVNIGISVFDYSNKAIEQILLKKLILAGDDIYALCWHPNGKDIYFSNGFGIFKINAITKKKTLIKEGCTSQIYTSIDISSDGTKLLVQKITVVKISETLLEEYSHVCELEINGLSERILF